MQSPRKRIDAEIASVAAELRRRHGFKRKRRTIYRYRGSLIETIVFEAPSWNSIGDASFSGAYSIGHLFEAQMHQNIDGLPAPDLFPSFDSYPIQRRTLKDDAGIESIHRDLLEEIEDLISKASASYAGSLVYVSTLHSFRPGATGVS